MLTRYGAIGDTLTIGEKDRYGRTTTADEAFGKWFGINIAAPTPQQAARERKAIELHLRASLAKIVKDPTVPNGEEGPGPHRDDAAAARAEEGQPRLVY